MELGNPIRASVMACVVASRTLIYIDAIKYIGYIPFDLAEEILFNNQVTFFIHEVRKIAKTN